MGDNNNNNIYLRGDPGIKIALLGQICQKIFFYQKCVGNIVLICKIIILIIKQHSNVHTLSLL